MAVRRSTVLAAAALALAAPAGAAAAASPADDGILTRGELAALVAGLRGVEARAPARPDVPVHVRQLDGALVRALGLGPAARMLQDGVAAAGLRPPARLGTEVVARLLGLGDADARPNDPVERAEAADSLALALAVPSWRIAEVEGLAEAFALPELGDWQRAVLHRALRFVGYPYVWGGESERAGFDCSGLVWRVYRRPFRSDPDGALAATIVGRTTYEMSGEVPADERVAAADLRPADLVFTADAGPDATPDEIGHVGIVLGGGWMIHSSTSGVTLVPLTGWYESRIAWGRRPLAEAGLEG